MGNSFDRLFRRLLRWLRRLSGEAQVPIGEELERKAWGVLWRLNSDEPGVVGTWAISHFESQSMLSIALISIAQLREDTSAGRHWQRSTDPFRTARGSFREQLRQYLEVNGNLDARFCTHILIVAWRSTIPSAAKSGRRYQVTPIAQIPGDYQGQFTASGDRYALAICDRMARQLLRKARPGKFEWKEIVAAIDWIDLVEVHAKGAIGRTHTLQIKVR